MIRLNFRKMPNRSGAIVIGIALVILCSSSSLMAQWTTGSGVVYTTNSSDKVGIGTSNPYTKLQVSGGDISVDSDQGIRKAGDNWIIGYSSSLPGIAIGSGTSTDKVKITAGGYERMRIAANGYVGIGTTTPGSSLDVSGGYDSEIRFGYGNGYQQGVLGSTVRSNYGHILFSRNLAGTSGSDNYQTLGTSSFGYNGVELRLGGDIVFYGTNANTTGGATFSAPTARMAILGTGNVGIGTTSPARKLTVSGATQADIALMSEDQGSSVSDGFNLQQVGVDTYLMNRESGSMSLWTDTTQRLTILSSGNVGVGTTNPQYKLDVNGTINSNSTITGNNIVAKYQDVAEWVPSSEQLVAGTVVVLDASKSNQVVSSTQSYDTRVAGVVSAQPGITLGEKGDNKVLVATTGRVKVKVDASKGPIHIGDLLVTSDIPGVAMKSEAVNLGGVQFHRPGTLIGKALEPWEKGKGEILVLLSLQ